MASNEINTCIRQISNICTIDEWEIPEDGFCYRLKDIFIYFPNVRHSKFGAAKDFG